MFIDPLDDWMNIFCSANGREAGNYMIWLSGWNGEEEKR
jgi:hypothetical protein